MKIMSIFGTRPEAIKLAPVIRELYRQSEQRDLDGDGKILRSVVCVTAQHREMLDQVLRLFNLVPDYDLNIMNKNQTPTQVASAVLTQLEPILKAEQPDWVLVQGDTTTAALSSLAAFYARVRVGHVEAGLRTRDKWQPFPEEINRRIAGVIADLHFAPTEKARENLIQEGVPENCVKVTGNPVIDALQWVAALPFEWKGKDGFWSALPSDKRLILVTAHRRESFGEPFVQLCQALRRIALDFSETVHLIYPVHLNPNVQKPVGRILADLPNVTLLPPLDYLPFVQLMKRAHLILTDSGGIQEEAPGLGIPVLVLRETTERPEALSAGTARLVGTDTETIIRETERLLLDPEAYQGMALAVNPFGDGQAAKRIVRALLGA